ATASLSYLTSLRPLVSTLISSLTFLLLLSSFPLLVSFFFFNDTATTEIYTLSLHDALPISGRGADAWNVRRLRDGSRDRACRLRSEEHTSELQSLTNLVCRLLLEKKKQKKKNKTIINNNRLKLTNSTQQSYAVHPATDPRPQ